MSGMKLTNIIGEAEDPVREGDVFLNKRNGEILLIIGYMGPSRGAGMGLSLI